MKYKLIILIFLMCSILHSCQEFVEVDVPDHRMESSMVFNDDETAKSAIQGIYNELSRASFSRGIANSVNVLAGLSSDNLTTSIETYLELQQFQEHELLPDNTNNNSLWASAYNIIYMCNAAIEGLESTSNVSTEVKSELLGQAKFLRAFCYFYLTNLYGEIPLILQTDYRANALAYQVDSVQVYEQMILDLNEARDLLPSTYPEGERTKATIDVANALLARVYLYLEDWSQAAYYSSQVINNQSDYHILTNLEEVFLANSQEALLQISPRGLGATYTNTPEGNFFIITSTPNYLRPVALTENLIEHFETDDLRLTEWVGVYNDNETLFYYPYKYKISYATGANYEEYSMVLRLAEQYLIHSESLINQNQLQEGIISLNKIRERAGIPQLDTQISYTQSQLLDTIAVERRRELFTEWGHRWLDLKRTQKAGDVLSEISPNWQSTDQLYPIPEEELLSNPNLIPNPGY